MEVLRLAQLRLPLSASRWLRCLVIDQAFLTLRT